MARRSTRPNRRGGGGINSDTNFNYSDHNNNNKKSTSLRPTHYVALLCLVVAYIEMRNLSNTSREEIASAADRLTKSLLREQQAAAETTLASTAQVQQESSSGSISAAVPMGCTPLQQRLIQKSIPTGKIIVDATKCPDSSAWLTSYLHEAPSSDTEPFVFLNFGCNKGYDSLFIAETISRKTDVFDKQTWAQAIGIGHPGNCYQGASDGNTPVDPNLPHRPVEVHCIEAMPQTADKLIQATRTTQARVNGLFAYNYAMTGAAGGAPILFPNPRGSVGEEQWSLADCLKEEKRHLCKEVPTKTIDEFVQLHVDSTGKPAGRRIPFLSIDVEGFDYTVMKGGRETLKRTDYLEFEYHNIGDWRSQRLRDAASMLQELGFVCYWSGVQQLWKLTDNCWMDHFEFHQWSNVACVNPQQQPTLAARMEQVFEDTLVQGVATTT